MQRVLLMTAILCGVVWLVAAGVCAAGLWYIQTVDSAGNVGAYTSLALDGSGYPHISYVDWDNGHLKYAAWNGTSWDIQTVDGTADVGYGTALALDASGYAHISYHDVTNQDLKYAAWNGSAWYIETVDSAGDVGRFNSLALDASGYARISYQDRTNGHLKYAARDGSGWDTQTVDSGGGVGRETSLALDASGHPHISYLEATNADLKYAAWDGTSWSMQTVDSGGDVGERNSMALDASGYPHISYFDATNYDLKYARWNGISWDIQAVDSAGIVGAYTSLALDASGHPHISYHDYLNEDLKYAAWSGSSWDIETVDAIGRMGFYTSLALDADGYAHISYYYADIGDLKYATTRPAPQASHELPAAGYYMISFPLTPTSATVHDVLCDDLGDGNYYMWRWRARRYCYETVPTSPPGCQSTTLTMRESYWVLTAAAALHVRGTWPRDDQRIPLQPGWNMIAAPYEATMDSLLVDNAGDVRGLGDAETAGWVLARFYYSHDGTGDYSTLSINQTPEHQLSFWHGYWVLAGVDCSLIVPEPPGGGAASSAAQRAPVEPTWAFDIQASTAGATDSITIAAADTASDGFDGFALDKPKPPAAPGERRVRMVLRGKGRRGTRASQRSPASQSSRASPPYNKAPGRQMPWSSELAMETKGTAQDVAEWHFTVTGAVQGEPVTLNWPELSRLPRDRVPILTDRDTGKRTFMRTRAQYEFAVPGDGSSRSFTVTVKPAQNAGVLISSFTVVPLRGGRGAELCFSLSADATVDISILNVAGRLVRGVRTGLAVEAGAHTVIWAGRSGSDTAVPRGLYLCVLNAKAADGQQARRVCPLAVRR